MCFLLTYDPSSKPRFIGAILVACLALITDVLDGRLARRWSVASETGGLVDGLGDKAFYIAVYLALAHISALPAILIWALIFREIALYGLRSIDGYKERNTRRLRWASLAYAAVIRLYFLCVFARGACLAAGFRVPPWLRFGDGFAYTAAVLGYIGLAKLIHEIHAQTSVPDPERG
jgi:phosphatidylglycerophosphate synthase